MKLGIAVAALVGLLATAALYGDLAWDAGWVLDDTPAVLDNPLAHWPPDPLPLLQSPWFGPAPSWSNQGVSRPLATLSFAVEDGLGLRVGSRHLASVALAALAAALLAALVGRLATAWRVPAASGTVAGVVAGLAFALLPAHAEAVMAVSNRPELLAACALLLAGHALLQLEGAALPALVSFAMALLAKESAIAALLPLALLAAAVPGRGRRESAGLALGLVAVAAIWAGLRFAFVAPPQIASEDNPLWEVDLATRLQAGIWLVWHAARRLVAPDLLAPDYSFDALPLLAPPSDELAVGAGLSVAALATMVVATYGLVRQGWANVGHSAAVSPTRASLALGLLTAAAFWAPVSQLLVPASLVTADRLLWLPSLGLCALAGAALGGVWSPVEQAWRLRRSGARTAGADGAGPSNVAWAALATSVALLAAALAVPATRQVAADWQGEATLFVRGVQLQPRSVKMRYNLGRLLLERGASRKALEQLQAALAIAPRDRAVGVLTLQAATRSGDCALGATLAADLRARGGEDAARIAILDDAMACHRFEEAWQAAQGIRRTSPSLAQRAYVAAIAAGQDEAAQRWARDHGVDALQDSAWIGSACWADDQAGRPASALRRLLAHHVEHPDRPGLAQQISARCDTASNTPGDPGQVEAAALCAEQWRPANDGGTGARVAPRPTKGRAGKGKAGGRAHGDP